MVPEQDSKINGYLYCSVHNELQHILKVPKGKERRSKNHLLVFQRKSRYLAWGYFTRGKEESLVGSLYAK